MKTSLLSGHFWHDLWIGFFLFLIVVGVLAGQPLMIAFGAMGLLAGAVSTAWNKLALQDLSYERHLPRRRVFAGEEVPLTVVLTNRKPVPLAWVNVEDELPTAFEVVEGDADVKPLARVQALRHSLSMAWYERVRWEYRLKCTRRGLHRIGPARIESGDPFGFLHSRTEGPDADSIIVYPRVFPLEQLGMPAVRPLGDVRQGTRIYPDPSRPSGIRDYQRGDPLKTIDWKATSKMRRMQVRVFDPSSTATVVLVVAIDTVEPHWAAYVPRALERVVTTAASVATYAAEQHYTLGLFSNDTPAPPGKSMAVPPSRNPDQLAEVLSAIATFRAFSAGPMYQHLAEHSKRFPHGSTIALITAFLPSKFVDVLGDLKSRGDRIVIIYVGEEACPDLPEGVVVHDLSGHLASLEESVGHFA